MMMAEGKTCRRAALVCLDLKTGFKMAVVCVFALLLAVATALDNGVGRVPAMGYNT
jgi:hypothetical protein